MDRLGTARGATLNLQGKLSCTNDAVLHNDCTKDEFHEN